MLVPALLLVALVSLAAFAAYGWDKRRARRGGRRVPEATLLWLAFFGGGAGALLAMRTLRHKTRHLRFRLLVPLFLLLQAAALGWLAWGRG